MNKKGVSMFASFFQKMGSFADHHQLLIAGIIAFSVICLTWGVEKLLELYLFPTKPARGYVAAVLLGLSLLWIIKHFTLREW